MYLPARIEKLGGLGTFVGKLLAAFGQADESKPIEQGTAVIWRRSDIDRRAAFGSTTDGAMLSVSDTALESILQSRRAKTANLGF